MDYMYNTQLCNGSVEKYVDCTKIKILINFQFSLIFWRRYVMYYIFQTIWFSWEYYSTCRNDGKFLTYVIGTMSSAHVLDILSLNTNTHVEYWDIKREPRENIYFAD